MPRVAGVLLHPTSLPGPYGIGDLGAGARAFVDWLVRARVGLWQTLPLVPSDAGGSPYSSWSAFAGNPDLIDLDELLGQGLLDPQDLQVPAFRADDVDYAAARAYRAPRLAKAAERLLAQAHHPWTKDLQTFRANTPWLADMALYAALKEAHRDAPFWEWSAALRRRDESALSIARAELARPMAVSETVQFFFARQWSALKRYANERGIKLIGDVPIYVSGDSVDVWANQHLFELDANGRAERVAGVPPDVFSDSGQLWGNPLYRWDVMAKDDFAWWCARLGRAVELTDWVRIDHFRGLAAYWAVPNGAADARGGQWIPGPGLALFRAITASLGTLPVIAEDLGVIDAPVRDLLLGAGTPGMRVLHFAFGGSADNLYLPHNHVEHAVVYTGTHDNDTTLGWWQSLTEPVRHHVQSYLGVQGQDIVWDLIRTALASVAHFAVVPMQDLLKQGSRARMNTPSRVGGNWRWRMTQAELREDVALRLRALIELYGRIQR